MISTRNIFTISTYEAKVLWRNWFFRIVSLLGIGFSVIFNLVVFSELDFPNWQVLANSWVLPSAALLMISIPQVAAVIFLATGLIKKDKKLDTNEVFFVRPITNLDYVFGKALALFKLFFLLNIVLQCIPLVVGLTSPFASVNLVAFAAYPLLSSVPTIVFTTGLSFLVVTLIRNQPITIVLLIGIAGVQLIYYFDRFSNILDFMAFRLSMLASDITGFVDIEFVLWQRTFYFLSGIAFLFITAFLLDRLASHRLAPRATLLLGIIILVLSSSVMVKVWNMRQDPIALREKMITINGYWSDKANADIISQNLRLIWLDEEIASTSELVLRNNTSRTLDTIYFTLNPDLVVDEILMNDSRQDVHRDLHIVSVRGIGIAPDQEVRLRIKYHGSINEAAAHLDVDQTRLEEPNDFLLYSLKKKYAYLEEDYVLLTSDVLWYPDTHPGYNRKSTIRQRRSFINFRLHVQVPAGKTPISQGLVTTTDGGYQFTPEYPLPQLSLVIGDYAKKEITVDGIQYSVFHKPENDYFVQHLGQLADTLTYLVSDIVNEYEDAQKLDYPFKRMQFVEVPLHFAAYNKIYESHQARSQPETVFWPEEGSDIYQFDFRIQLRDMTAQAARANQTITDKQKQANVFNDLVRKVFTKQIGAKWIFDGYDPDKPDYSVFPNYYDFNSGVVSEDWALLNRSIATYIRNDKQIQNDYSRNIKGISFTEECNNLMRTTPVRKILTQAEFNKISKAVTLKSQYLFSYIGHMLGEETFKSFLYDWVNSHQHQLTTYEDFRGSLLSRFNVDIDPVIRKVFSETSQPAFELVDLQKYEVMDGDRKRYQVLVTVKNSGDSDGVLEMKFTTNDQSDDDDYSKVNQPVAEEAPGKLSVVKKEETKVFGFVLDEKPDNLSINTIISKNIPSVINLPIMSMARQEGRPHFEGERTVHNKRESDQYEVIVDNEDPGFTSFSPIKPTMLKAYLDSRTSANQKYFGMWSASYSRWLPTTGSDFYGNVIRSAHFTRSGNGEKIATWTPRFEEEGFYDIYVHMKGKNQNEFHGNDGDGREFNYHYLVTNADGTDNIKYNISNAEPGWNYLGSYYFTKTGGSVALTDECELRTVYADAVKWIKQ